MITRVDLPVSRGCGLKRESPGRLLAQIDAGEPFRGLPAASAAFNIASRSAGEPLRLQRSAAGIIEAHPTENFHEFVGVMRRPHDALQRVAAGTIEQEAFLLVRARHAHQPFGIGEMGGQVLRFFELDLNLGFLARGHIRGTWLHPVHSRPRALSMRSVRVRVSRPGKQSGPRRW